MADYSNRLLYRMLRIQRQLVARDLMLLRWDYGEVADQLADLDFARDLLASREHMAPIGDPHPRWLAAKLACYGLTEAVQERARPIHNRYAGFQVWR